MERAPRLLDVMNERLRLRRASPRTAEAYLGWVRRFARFHHPRHPREMGAAEITGYLSHLATVNCVAVSGARPCAGKLRHALLRRRASSRRCLLTQHTQPPNIGLEPTRLMFRAIMSPRRAAQGVRYAGAESIKRTLVRTRSLSAGVKGIVAGLPHRRCCHAMRPLRYLAEAV